MKYVFSILIVLLLAGSYAACLNSDRKAAADSKIEEKQDPKAQREDSLKLFHTKLEEFVKLSPPTNLASVPYLRYVNEVLATGRCGGQVFRRYELVFGDGKAFIPADLKNIEKIEVLLTLMPAEKRVNGKVSAN